MAQSWLTLELTDSQAWVGLVNGLPAVAVIALTLYGGVLAERYPKKKILASVRLLLLFWHSLLGAWLPRISSKHDISSHSR